MKVELISSMGKVVGTITLVDDKAVLDEGAKSWLTEDSNGIIPIEVPMPDYSRAATPDDGEIFLRSLREHIRGAGLQASLTE